MQSAEFIRLRKKLRKTQKEIAQLLGKSLKAIHSYEQDWRRIPPDVERMMLFLISRKRLVKGRLPECWTILNCPDERRERCPAWEYHSGEICWFINGTICAGKARTSWQEKIKACRQCDVFRSIFREASLDTDCFEEAFDPQTTDSG